MTHVAGCHLTQDRIMLDKDRITGSLHWCGHGTVNEKEGKIRNQSRDTLRLQLSLHPTDVVCPSSPVSYCLWSGCFLCSYKSQHIQNHFPLIYPMLGTKRFVCINYHTNQDWNLFFSTIIDTSAHFKLCSSHFDLFPRNDALVRK